MNSIWNQTTTQLTSGFAMPTSATVSVMDLCGHASAASEGRIAMSATRVGATGAVLGGVARDRQGAIAQTLGHAEKSFPGTPAWRPPTS